MIRISDFRIKEVINISDGKRLGTVQDIDINLQTGKINAITLSRTQKILGLFGREEDILIPWVNVVKIGQDVILVKMVPIYEKEEIQMETRKI